jgi:hypothetical protein
MDYVIPTMLAISFFVIIGAIAVGIYRRHMFDKRLIQAADAGECKAVEIKFLNGDESMWACARPDGTIVMATRP